MKVLSDINVSGKRVFVRADLDVPLREAQVTSDKLQVISYKSQIETASRLLNIKPTVDWLLEHGASQIVIAGHIDRPKGPDPLLSTKQLLEPLEKILGHQIIFCSDLSTYPKPGLGQLDKPGLGRLGRIFLLENLRYWPGEEKNDLEFAQKLASIVDVYVNEAFAVCHRNHASVVALPLLFTDVEDPEGLHPRRAAGLHLEKEVEVLSKLLKNSVRPYVAIVGGVKIETKLPVIENLSKLADSVLIGGTLPLEIAQEGISFSANVVVAGHDVDGKDITSESQDQFAKIIKYAKTVVWNGPMGVFEEGFDKGTRAIVQAIIQSGAYSVVGGGETAQFLAQNNLLSKFSFVSSGGGAMLEFLSGKTLPALAVLR